MSMNSTEEKEMRTQERKFMTQKRLNIYIACEDYDFTWDVTELATFRTLWRAGLSIPDIAKEMHRHEIEVAILAMDQAEQARIKPRDGGILGKGVGMHETLERSVDQQTAASGNNRSVRKANRRGEPR